MKNKFNQGDVLEGINKPDSKIRILAVSDSNYKVFVLEQEKFEILPIYIVEAFYYKLGEGVSTCG